MSTPLMKQYVQMKSKYPETVLLFRLGDFYETFEDDAKITSRVLGLTLTKRNNGAAGEIPLAGFPHHALDAYLPKLLKAGYRVAICEQLEDPKFAKGIVKLDVVEVVTPGVAFSDNVLEQKQNNYLLAVSLPSPITAGDELIGMAFTDVSTGEFDATEFPFDQIREQIAGLQPSEILVQKRDAEAVSRILAGHTKAIFTKLDDWIYNFDYAYELLINHFRTQTLKGFGIEEYRPGIVAAGAVMNYLQETQKTNILHIKKIVPFNTHEHINLDLSTKRNLEITRSIEGREDGTLFWVLDKTRTPMGGRLLKKWINQPLKKSGPIRQRLEAVRDLSESTDLREELAAILSHIGDLERLISKICTNRANPREVASMKGMLTQITALKHSLTVQFTGKPDARGSTALRNITERIEPLDHLVTTIAAALEDDPPLSLADGGVIRKGYNTELDGLRDIALNGKSWIANLQKTERYRTGISSLKVPTRRRRSFSSTWVH